MKWFRYFLLILFLYLFIGYIFFCFESGTIENPLNVFTVKKIGEALLFSVVMTIVYWFSPKDEIEKQDKK